MVIFYRRILILFFSVLGAVFAYFFVVYNSQNCYFKYRCLQYCNIDHFPVGNEGTENSVMKLHLVYSIVRHGDRFTRSPKLFKGEKMEGVCQLDGLLEETNAYELFQTLGNYLKQNNSTRSSYLNQALRGNHFGNCEESELTPRGYFQAFLLGNFFFKRYFGGDDAMNLDDTKIIVRSSNYNRTIQTALTITSALLNNSRVNFNTDNLKFEIVEDNSGFLMNDYLNKTILECYRLRYKYMNIDYSELIIAHQQFMNLYPKLKQLLNKNEAFANLKLVDVIIDYINVQFCHPEYKVSEYLKKFTCNERVQLISMADEYLHFTYNSMGAEDITLPILARLFYVIDGSSEKSSKSFYLDATHDTTIVALLLAIKLPRKYWPPYIARLVFEIYLDNKNIVFIKLLYNGNDVTCESQYCSSDCQIHNNTCNYNTFKTLFLKGLSLEETWMKFVTRKC